MADSTVVIKSVFRDFGRNDREFAGVVKFTPDPDKFIDGFVWRDELFGNRVEISKETFGSIVVDSANNSVKLVAPNGISGGSPKFVQWEIPTGAGEISGPLGHELTLNTPIPDGLEINIVYRRAFNRDRLSSNSLVLFPPIEKDAQGIEVHKDNLTVAKWASVADNVSNEDALNFDFNSYTFGNEPSPSDLLIDLDFLQSSTNTDELSVTRLYNTVTGDQSRYLASPTDENGNVFAGWYVNNELVSNSRLFLYQYTSGHDVVVAAYQESVVTEEPQEEVEVVDEEEQPIEEEVEQTIVKSTPSSFNADAECDSKSTTTQISSFELSFNVIQQGINDQMNLPLTESEEGVYTGSFKIESSDGVFNRDGLAAIIVNFPNACTQVNSLPCNIDDSDPYNKMNLTVLRDFTVNYGEFVDDISPERLLEEYKNSNLINISGTSDFHLLYDRDDSRFMFGNPKFFRRERS